MDYKVFPNPSYSTVFTILAPPSDHNQSYAIYSVDGSLIMGGSLTKGTNIVSMDRSLNGLYMIRLVDGDDVSMKKILLID